MTVSAAGSLSVTGINDYDKAGETLTLLNEKRAEAGLSALTMTKDLTDAAMLRAAEISVDFSHTRPNGDSFYSVNDNIYGENIAAGQTTAQAVINSWMNSDGHRKNMLDADWNTVGIGCFIQGGRTYWVQEFGYDGSGRAETGLVQTAASIDISGLSADSFSLDSSLESGLNVTPGKSARVTLALANADSSAGSFSFTPDNADISWGSDNSSILTVTNNGTYTGIRAGSANITATVAAIGKTFRIPVTVTGNAEKLYESPATNTPVTPKGSLTITTDADAGQITATVRFSEGGGNITGISMPTWSDADGQDDLIWYAPSMNSDGSYTSVIDIKDHNYVFGDYHIHCYCKDSSGKMVFIDAAESSISLSDESMTVTKLSDTRYKVEITGLVVPGGAREVSIPVWSEKNGQDDIHWYSAAKTASDTWSAIIDLKNHRSRGVYFVHAYAVDRNGHFHIIQTADFNTGSPEADISVPSADLNLTNGSFTVEIDHLTDTGLVDAVYVPVWSDANGQDDIRWYQAQRQSDGSYRANVKISDHNYSLGVYNAHFYCRTIFGEWVILGAKTVDLSPTLANYTVTKNDSADYTATITGLNVPGGADSVIIPVWSQENGQDDIVWYYAEKTADGVYTARINIRNHQSTGLYFADAYVITKGRGFSFIGSAEFTVEKPSTDVSVISENVSDGVFTVHISAPTNAGLIKTVYVPIWSDENGQDDIRWYKAAKQSDGSYLVKVNIADHHYSYGVYHIHVYAETIQGHLSFMGKTTLDDMVIHYDDFTLTKAGDDYIARITGLIVPGGASRVEIPTWSAPGQRDIIWYQALLTADGAYECRIKGSSLLNPRSFVSHAYAVTKNGGYHFIAASD